MGKIFVAAIVLLMARPASAQIVTGQCVDFDAHCNIVEVARSCSGPMAHPECLGLSLSSVPSSVMGSFPTKTKCSAGWTLVDVASRVSGGETIIHKCAAVGDLRDPE